MIMEAPHPLSFDLLTSIRSDPLLTTSTPNTILSTAPKHPTQFYMILYHRERLLAAAQDFQWQEAAIALSGPIGLLRLEKSLHEHLGSKYGNPAYPAPLKLRVLLSPMGIITATSSPTPPLSLSTLFPTQLPLFPGEPTWRVFLSPHYTLRTLHTTHKTTLRIPYDAARALIPSSALSALTLMAEILLVNEDGDIMEGSLTTPYFWRGGAWVTPKAESGGNLGTTRRWAVERVENLVEGRVERVSVEIGEKVWLSNGVRGWGWGKVEKIGREGS